MAGQRSKAKESSYLDLLRKCKEDPGLDAGATTVAYLHKMVLNIPLSGNQVSVGIVRERLFVQRFTVSCQKF